MILPTKNSSVELSPAYVDALRKLWPTKDVDTELAKMLVWLTDHPARRPVRWPRFLRNWMRLAPDVSPPPMPVGAGWWRSETGTLETGRNLGINPRPGEDMRQYRERIAGAIKRTH